MAPLRNALAAMLLVAASPAVHALQILDGKLQSISSAGIADHTATFPSENGGSKVVTLSSTSTLKLSFALDKPEEAGFSALILSTIDPRALPSQLGQVTNSNEAGLWRLANRQVSSASIPLVAKKGGRYRWEWDLATPSSTSYKEDILTIARLSEGRLKAQLLVAAAQKGDADKTLLVDLGTVAILDETYYQVNPNKKWLREWEMERYWSRPEISWTFREATKPVSSFKALIGLVTVLSPWLVLVSLAGFVYPTLTIKPSSTNLPFISSLGALEAAIASYWFGFITVWTFMPTVGVLGLVAILSGKSALGYKMRQRVWPENDAAVGVEKKDL